MLLFILSDSFDRQPPIKEIMLIYWWLITDKNNQVLNLVFL